MLLGELLDQECSNGWMAELMLMENYSLIEILNSSENHFALNICQASIGFRLVEEKRTNLQGFSRHYGKNPSDRILDEGCSRCSLAGSP